jgi:phage major head subunit gpT-like protein
LSLGPTIAQREAIENARISLHTFFLESLDGAAADPIEELAMQVPSSTAVEEYDWIGDIPGLVEWLGDREMATVMVGSFTIKNKDWSSGARIHKNEILDHRLAQTRAKLQGLAQEARYHYGDLLARCLLNGFDGQAFPDVGTGLCYDGRFLFSADHRAEGGPAQSNLLNVPLDAEGLRIAKAQMRKLRNHKGTRPVRVRPTHLIVGPDLEDTAKRLLNQEIVPGGPNGNASITNIHRGSLQLLVSDWIVGEWANCWFLADLSKPIKPLILQIREPITSTALTDWSTEVMFRRGEQQFGAQSRDNVGLGAWQPVIGSRVAA